MQIFIGQKLYGYCDGYFGRDSYETKRIEGFGIDWIVARESDWSCATEEIETKILFAEFNSREEMIKLVKRWSKGGD